MVENLSEQQKPTEKTGEKVMRMLDNPDTASTQMADLYRQLRNDPAAFRTELQAAQKLSWSDKNPGNDLEIIYDSQTGAVDKVEIKREWARDNNIFDRTSVDQQFKVEDLQKIDPAKAKELAEPLLKNNGDGNALFKAIDAVDGKADGTINKDKLEAFLHKDVKPGDDPSHLYSNENREAVKQILAQWDTDDSKHLRGQENTNYGTIFTPNYVQSDSLSLNRLSQVLDKPGDQLLQGFAQQNNSESIDELSKDIDAAPTPAQELAEFYAKPHTQEELAQKESELMAQARGGTRYLSEHPDLMSKLTKEVPLVEGSSNTRSYFDKEKIDNFQSESIEEMAVVNGLKASDVYLAQYGKQHFGDPLAPNKLDSLPVDQLVKMVFYFEDTTIKTMADVRQRYGATQSQ